VGDEHQHHGLLDLSVAFDCVNHQLLLQRLRRDFGISDTVSAWITSVLFVMYTDELSHIIARHGLQFHQYADDCQIYVSLPVTAVNSTVHQFSRCLYDVEAWMSASSLRLNPSKTVVLWLGSRHVIDKLDVYEVQVLSSTVKINSPARDLGVVVDSR